MAFYLAASVVALFAPSIGMLLAARLVQGFGASAGLAVARAVVRDPFAHEASSRIMNLIGIILAIGPALKEIVDANPARLNPLVLLRSYATLVSSGRFMTVSMVLAASIGAIYAQATFLPFIMMDRVGLSPAQFGLSMICQSGSFFTGALVVRRLMRSRSACALVPAGRTMTDGRPDR